ncbi:MAG: hypothetical protein QNJ97_07430 [Myxococcota bacterium]|nr:hypothetical protein [Myxococcota bacterium]
MTESKKKGTRRSAKPKLKVEGILRMPEDILPWEFDLLGPMLGAIQDAGVRHVHSKTGVMNNGQ